MSTVPITIAIPAGATAVRISFDVPAPSTPPAPPATPPPSPPPPTGAWTPPVGIPEPPFGVREKSPPFPSPWTVEIPGHYYVDPSGSDARAYGTPSAPRRTIPSTLPAGAVVEVQGSYDYAPTGYSTIGVIGTPDKPIFIRGAAGVARPAFRRELHITGSYIILENLAFADYNGTLCGAPVLLAPAHHVCIRDCEISGNKVAGGALLVSWDGQRGGDFVLLRCKIHDCGDWQIATDQDKHGVGVGDVDHVWILDCEMTKCSGDGVQINGKQAGQARTRHIYVGRCNSFLNKQSGLWCKQATDVVFSENIVSQCRASPSTPKGAGMGFQYAPERVWFLYNQISDCETGFFTGSDSGLGSGRESFFVGNRVRAIHSPKTAPTSSWSSGAAFLLAGGLEPWVINNSIDRCDAGVYSPNTAARLHLGENVVAGISPGFPDLIDGIRVIEIGALPALRARFQSLYGIALP